MTQLDIAFAGARSSLFPSRARGRRLRLGRLVRADVLAWVGLVILAIVVMAAVFAPWLAPYPDDGTSATHPAQSLLGPSGAHWMGTDLVGRDVFSRVLYGARTSLTIVVAVLAIAATVGVLLGVTAGYAGGLVRDVILRITDIFLAFPALLLSLALAVVLHAGLGTAIIAIAVTWWPWYTRLTVSLASSIRSRGYVEAARCLGVSPVRLVVRHVLPNSLTPVLVQLVARRRWGHPHCRGAVLPGARRPGTDERVGTDGRAGSVAVHDGLVGRDLPGPGDPGDRLRLQRARRGGAVRARPTSGCAMSATAWAAGCAARATDRPDEPLGRGA